MIKKKLKNEIDNEVNETTQQNWIRMIENWKVKKEKIEEKKKQEEILVYRSKKWVFKNPKS